VSKTPIDGVLVVDKPRGPTSHDVVARIRKALGTREVGHAGTLDPMATGVLVLALGEATKLVPWLTAADKRYETEVGLGVETDTLDAQGAVTATKEISPALQAALAEARTDFVPEALLGAIERELRRTEQIPPAYSAIKKGGEAAHAKARRGEDPGLEPRAVRANLVTLLASSASPPALTFRLEVSKGYYVRSFARDLARALGTVGHLTMLRRIASGAFEEDEAISPDAPPEALRAAVIPLAAAAKRALPSVTLDDRAALAARQGKLLAREDLPGHGEGPHAWLDPAGTLVAVGELTRDGRGRVLRGFAPR
jgi:tRNA pseudouridine55 synthase